MGVPQLWKIIHQKANGHTKVPSDAMDRKEDVDRQEAAHAFVEAQTTSPELKINRYPPGQGAFSPGCSRPKEVPISKVVECKAEQARAAAHPKKDTDTSRNEDVQLWVNGQNPAGKDQVPDMTVSHHDVLCRKRAALAKAEDAYQNRWKARTSSPDDMARIQVAVLECKKQQKTIMETTAKIRNMSVEK